MTDVFGMEVKNECIYDGNIKETEKGFSPPHSGPSVEIVVREVLIQFVHTTHESVMFHDSMEFNNTFLASYNSAGSSIALQLCYHHVNLNVSLVFPLKKLANYLFSH